MDSNAELPLATLLWQQRLSSWLVTIVCKATFKLLQKQLTLASAHEPVFTADAFWDDDENRSLSTASELVPSKPKADVIVVGSAFAPGGRPVRSLVSAATPFTEHDEALKRSVDGATQFLATSGLVAAPDVATAMTTKVREAFAASDRDVPGSYLDDQTERALLGSVFKEGIPQIPRAGTL